MNPWEEILAHATRQRVKDEQDLMAMIIESRLEKLESENARLREALQRIEQNQMCDYGCDCGSSADQIARAALEEKE